MINHLSDHYVVCGYGRIGSIVAGEFTRQNTPFVIVDRDPARVPTPTNTVISRWKGTPAAKTP